MRTRTVLSLFMGIFLMAGTSFGWTNWQWMNGGASSPADDYGQSFASNGDFYKTKDNGLLYYVPYGWGPEELTSGLGTIACVTISPDKKSGFVADDGHVWSITSADGKTWTKDTEYTGWYKPGNPIADITCAWSHNQKYLYGMRADRTTEYAAISNYNITFSINFDSTGDGKVEGVDVRAQGDRAIISDMNVTQRDFYELTSANGIIWIGKTVIPEVNTNDDELYPVIAAFGGSIRCAGSRNRGSGYYFDPFWSTDGSNSAVEPTSLGKVKAMFR